MIGCIMAAFTDLVSTVRTGRVGFDSGGTVRVTELIFFSVFEGEVEYEGIVGFAGSEVWETWVGLGVLS